MPDVQGKRAPEERGEPQARRPAIRTMRSDVAEFLQSPKAPSLASVIASRGTPESRAIPPHWFTKRWILAFVGVSVLVLAASGALMAYWRLGEVRPPAPGTPAQALPPPIPFESQVSRTIGPDAARLSAWLREGPRALRPTGLGRLVTLRGEPGGSSRPFLPGDLFALTGAAPPPALSLSLAGPIEFFASFEPGGTRLGLLTGTTNPARTREGLLAWEPSLARELEFLFPERTPRPDFRSFPDRTFRNIDFRYLDLEPDRDLGIGYVVFAAQKVVVIATSEQSLRTIIERLLQTR